MDADVLEAMYTVMIRYIAEKEMQGAADHVVETIIEAGVDDEALQQLSNVDRFLKQAISDQTELDSDDEDEEYH